MIVDLSMFNPYLVFDASGSSIRPIAKGYYEVGTFRHLIVVPRKSPDWPWNFKPIEIVIKQGEIIINTNISPSSSLARRIRDEYNVFLFKFSKNIRTRAKALSFLVKPALIEREIKRFRIIEEYLRIKRVDSYIIKKFKNKYKVVKRK
ncbi:MAG: hypothetical protein Q6363_007730 [Candidatus Njordarchaeota archaeon]